MRPLNTYITPDRADRRGNAGVAVRCCGVASWTVGMTDARCSDPQARTRS